VRQNRPVDDGSTATPAALRLAVSPVP